MKGTTTMDDAIKCRMAWEGQWSLSDRPSWRLHVLDSAESVGVAMWAAIEGTGLGTTLDDAARELAEWNARRVANGHRPLVVVAGPPGRPQVKPGTAVRWHNGRWEWRNPKLGWTRAD